MKRKINIICVLILAVIIYSSLSSLLFIMGYGVRSGLQVGMKSDDVSYDLTSLGIDYAFIPEQQTFIAGADTLVLSSGQKVRFIPSSGYILKDGVQPCHQKSFSSDYILVLITSLVYIVVFVLCILALVDFIRFIVEINRNRIFEYRNVRFLNRVGVYMLVVAALLIISGVVREFVQAPYIPELSGYEVAINWSIPVSEILIGLLALLMGQIWLRAITIKEEQELTI